MSEWTIIHNPRWGTSRKALQLLRDNSIEPNIVNYIKNPLDNKYIEQLSEMLGLHPNQFMRKKEQLFINMFYLFDNLKKGFVFAFQKWTKIFGVHGQIYHKLLTLPAICPSI